MEGEDGEQKGVVVRSERTIKGEIRETKNHPEGEEIENEEEGRKRRRKRTKKETHGEGKRGDHLEQRRLRCLGNVRAKKRDGNTT